MKYTLIRDFEDGTFTRSRFMSKKMCERFKQPFHKMLSKTEAIQLGYFVEPKEKQPVRTYVRIEMVKGLFDNNNLSIARMYKANTENYESFCMKNGYLIPIG